jgi:hypothetical protein
MRDRRRLVRVMIGMKLLLATISLLATTAAHADCNTWGETLEGKPTVARLTVVAKHKTKPAPGCRGSRDKACEDAGDFSYDVVIAGSWNGDAPDAAIVDTRDWECTPGALRVGDEYLMVGPFTKPPSHVEAWEGGIIHATRDQIADVTKRFGKMRLPIRAKP